MHESELENLILSAFEQDDYFNWFLSRGLDISPLKNGLEPSGEAHLYHQPILDKFGRGDVFISWNGDSVTILELKVNALKCDFVGQTIRYKSFVESNYPKAKVRAIIIVPCYEISKSHGWDPILLAAASGVDLALFEYNHNGLEFTDMDLNLQTVVSWISGSNIGANKYHHYEPFRIRGGQQTKKIEFA